VAAVVQLCHNQPVLADPLVYLWPLGVSVFIALTFLWVVIRGTRTGRLSQYRGGHIDRARFPAMFWFVAAIYIVSGAVILAIAFGNFWKPLMSYWGH
jgi:hypothetical protein